MPNTTWDFSLNVKVTDSVGNVWITIPDPIKIELTNVELTWTSFNLALDNSGNNEYIATWNWKRLTEAKAWDCENITINWDIQCSSWTWTTYWDYFTYTVTLGGQDEITGLYCNLTITDWDSDIQVTWYFIDCSQTWNDGCKPSLKPVFTWWSQYVHHIINGDDLWKYTSWTNVSIQINWKWVSKLSWYRYTCVQQGRYCSKPSNRNYESLGITGLNAFITDNNLERTVKICTQTGPARSDRISYNRNENGNDTFNIDLNGSTGACDQTGMVYASKFEWTRRVWIELEDIKWYTWLEPTDYIVYSKESPNIKILSESEVTKWTTPYWWPEKKPNIPTINSWNVTVNVIVNGANLPTGESWLNYIYSW